jgi:HD-GYP domain-containing protein (c-di-GMP phosphodiesterase class II)
MRSYPLKTFVKRILLIRLGVAALVLALTAGAVTYFYQKELLSRQVADIGRQGIATLTRRVMEAAERQEIEPAAALPQVLAAAAETPTAYLLGHFVFVQFLDRSGTVVAEGSAPAADQVEAGGDLAKARPLVFPETGRAEAETHRRGDGLFVLSVVPVADRLGAVKGYARGVFAVSTEAGQQMRRAVMRSALIVVAIVCGVTAILYPVILQLTRRLADYSSSLLDANLETLAVLGSAIAKRDADTDAHNYRVSLYSVRLGEAIGLDPAAMRGLIKGAFIHDVGKIGIPDAVLLKAGRLDAEEYRIMQSHVEAGVDIVSRSAWLRDSIPVVAAHHEKYGGGGYPKGARSQEIPLAARIFAIADVFDALTSERPYKKPLSFEETMRILEEGRGVHFDPDLLDVFAVIARRLYDAFAGHDGSDLRQVLVAAVDPYFSAGIESLFYS